MIINTVKRLQLQAMAVKRHLTPSVIYRRIVSMAVKKVIRRIKKVEVVPEMVVPVVPQKSLTEKAVPFMMLALVVMAFMLGLMWNKLQGAPAGPMKFSDKLVAYAKD